MTGCKAYVISALNQKPWFLGCSSTKTFVFRMFLNQKPLFLGMLYLTLKWIRIRFSMFPFFEDAKKNPWMVEWFNGSLFQCLGRHFSGKRCEPTWLSIGYSCYLHTFLPGNQFKSMDDSGDMVIGGRDDISPPKGNLFTWYISRIYCQLSYYKYYILPTSPYNNQHTPLIKTKNESTISY